MAGGIVLNRPTNSMENYFMPVTCGQVTPVPSPTATPTQCPLVFNDVPATNTFYPYVRCLVCLGVVSGYPCGGPGEPCPGAYYRPGNNVTRGQLAKIVANSAALTDPVPTSQTFEDVPPGNAFFAFVERVAGHDILSGYPCGGPFEPCVPPGNRPYFRPGNNATRGQIAKIVSNGAGWSDTPTAQMFEDVPSHQPVLVFIERLASRGISAATRVAGRASPASRRTTGPTSAPATTRPAPSLPRSSARLSSPAVASPPPSGPSRVGLAGYP